MLSYNRRRYEESIALGRCPHCHKNGRGNSCLVCEECRNRQTQREIERKIQRSSNGLCIKCGLPAVVFGRNSCCEEHWYKRVSSNSTKTESNWALLRDKLVNQDYRCYYTGKLLTIGVNASIDHVISRFNGGDNSLSNLVWVDMQINRMKNDMSHDEFIQTMVSIMNHFGVDYANQSSGRA